MPSHSRFDLSPLSYLSTLHISLFLPSSSNPHHFFIKRTFEHQRCIFWSTLPSKLPSAGRASDSEGLFNSSGSNMERDSRERGLQDQNRAIDMQRYVKRYLRAPTTLETVKSMAPGLINFHSCQPPYNLPLFVETLLRHCLLPPVFD